MCGRFITTGTWAEYRKYMSILPPEVDGRNGPEPNYNTAPTSTLEIVTSHDGGIGIEPVKWGLVPHWSKDTKVRMMINARGETVAEKPFFRTAFEYGRCLIPATGYYEWLVLDKKTKEKQPYLIHLPGDAPTFEPFAFAGIMSRNKNLDTVTFAIVTLAATDNIAHIHDRMPVILKGGTLEAWMNPETGRADALDLLQDNRGTDLVYYPVSHEVGSVKNKGPELISEI
ncbi:SOS response-associated peptidase [Hoeflea sp. TYP-13]|uniref:SOS response-associated peptidase n=1 Tax=Hoeflea sp. TYP-13 TaxID=3230023 RepID=UPI0034C68234